jgi:L-rhamnose mutarotase
MGRMAADETTRRWWALTDPCQQGLTSRKQGEWWAPMIEVFHSD